MKQKEVCKYCDSDKRHRKEYGKTYDKAWVNVERKTLDVSAYAAMGFICITHCPWCGREL